MSRGKTTMSAVEAALENELKPLAHLPKKLGYPDQAKKDALANSVRDHLKADARIISDLEKKLGAHTATGGVEKVNDDPDPGELNMQLALTRLVADEKERTHARLHGKAFQVKYNLSNEQMFTLCRLAVEIGFYQNTNDLKEYLEEYAKLSPALRALTPDSGALIGLNDKEVTKAIIGSCSCSCP
jgi:hypothetical protein